MDYLSGLVAQAREFCLGEILRGANAVVVGGNKGLGQGIALALAAAGADVCVVGRGPAGLEETAAAIQQLGRNGHSLAYDVTDEAYVRDMTEHAIDRLGRIDILVNSQGAVHLQAGDIFDMNQWSRVIDVNLKSVVMVCKHVGHHMLDHSKGRIINLSSVRGFQGRIGDLAYSPSKGGVNQLTKSLALEWGSKGINVNAIAPSFIRAEISDDYFRDPVKREWVISRSPMGRIGEVRDIFGPAIFLASPMADFVNGHVLLVDGGWVVG